MATMVEEMRCACIKHLPCALLQGIGEGCAQAKAKLEEWFEGVMEVDRVLQQQRLEKRSHAPAETLHEGRTQAQRPCWNSPFRSWHRMKKWALGVSDSAIEPLLKLVWHSVTIVNLTVRRCLPDLPPRCCSLLRPRFSPKHPFVSPQPTLTFWARVWLSWEPV